jgi:hypothetical protein
MCQHFYGHKIKLLLATFRNQQVTCNHSLNDVVYGYKKPRYIQRFLALLNDEEWAIISKNFEPKSKRGRPREHVQKDIVNAILSILKGGYYLANDAE